jgi:hypothetical protein
MDVELDQAQWALLDHPIEWFTRCAEQLPGDWPQDQQHQQQGEEASVSDTQMLVEEALLECQPGLECQWTAEERSAVAAMIVSTINAGEVGLRQPAAAVECGCMTVVCALVLVQAHAGWPHSVHIGARDGRPLPCLLTVSVFARGAGGLAEEDEQQQQPVEVEDLEMLRLFLGVSLEEEDSQQDAKEDSDTQATYESLEGKLHEPLYDGTELTLLQVGGDGTARTMLVWKSQFDSGPCSNVIANVPAEHHQPV